MDRTDLRALLSGRYRLVGEAVGSNHLPSTLICFILLFVACKESEVGFVFLENATSETLQITARFQGVDTASKPLVFNLAPGDRDGWRFISDEKDSEEADSTLQSLLVKSKKCERQIDRPTLEKSIRKNGSWVLRIDGVLFSC